MDKEVSCSYSVSIPENYTNEYLTSLRKSITAYMLKTAWDEGYYLRSAPMFIVRDDYFPEPLDDYYLTTYDAKAIGYLRDDWHEDAER